MKKYSRFLLKGLIIGLFSTSFALAANTTRPGMEQPNDMSDSMYLSSLGEMQMSYSVTDSISPGKINRHEIIIDRTKRVSFVFFTSGNLQVVVTDPNGIRTDSASAKQNEVSSYINLADQGMLSVDFGNKPPPGKWIIEVSPGKGNNQKMYYTLMTSYSGSDVRLEVRTDRHIYFKGDTILVTAILNKGAEPILGATVEAHSWIEPQAIDTLNLYPESVDTLRLFDDGTHGDPKANDGRYTNAYAKTSKSAYLTISVRAHGDAPEAFTRDGSTGVSITKSRAKFIGTFSEYTQDTNGDSLFDELVIKVGLKITDSDTYSIRGELYNKDGKAIAIAYVDTFLTSRDSNVLLMLNGKDIYNSRSNGPYYLGHLSISIMDEGMEYSVDYLEKAYVTKKYSVWEFQGGGLELVGNFTDRGIDVDGNGLYDSLLVTMDVDLRQSDYYYWQGTMFGSDKMQRITYAFGQGVLEPGRRTITIAFDGTAIGQSGVDGPYEVFAPAMYGQMYAKKGANMLGEHFRTKAYRASQFEK